VIGTVIETVIETVVGTVIGIEAYSEVGAATETELPDLTT
jgi:hypothetical protein